MLNQPDILDHACGMAHAFESARTIINFALHLSQMLIGVRSWSQESGKWVEHLVSRSYSCIHFDLETQREHCVGAGLVQAPGKRPTLVSHLKCVCGLKQVANGSRVWSKCGCFCIQFEACHMHWCQHADIFRPDPSAFVVLTHTLWSQLSG